MDCFFRALDIFEHTKKMKTIILTYSCSVQRIVIITSSVFAYSFRKTKHERASCPPNIIRNCFIHCWKQGGADEEDKTSKETFTSMKRDVEENKVQIPKPNLKSNLNPSEDDCMAEEVTLDSAGEEIAGMEKPETKKKN